MEIRSHLPEPEEGVVRPGDGLQPQKPPDASFEAESPTVSDDSSTYTALLVERLKRHEQDAWDEFIESCYAAIYYHIRGFGHDHSTAEDLTQETFLRAYCKIGRLEDGRKVYGWIYTIATRFAWRHRTMIRRRRGIDMNVGLMDCDDGVSLKLESQVDLENDLKKLHGAVNRLSPKLREAIMLRYIGRLSIADCAMAAGVASGTFRRRLHDARMALKDIMDDGSKG
jgi:RNA polymerase sigma-70 factor (ECF subfamily)